MFFQRNIFFTLLLLFSLNPSNLLGVKLFNVPIRNPNFVGRDNFLNSINSHINKRNNLIYVQGLSGIGKSQIAREYAYRYQRDYDIIWWFDCNRSLKKQLIQFAYEWNRLNKSLMVNDLSLNEMAIYPALVKVFKSYSGKILFIFDNAKREGLSNINFSRDFQNGKVSIIITTAFLDKNRNNITIKEFEKNESYELLRKILGEKKGKSFSVLADMLGHIPLSIMRSAAYIKKAPSLDIDEYVSIMIDDNEKVKKLEDTASGVDELSSTRKSFLKTLEVSLDELKVASFVSYECFMFLLYLNPKGIKKKDILNWLELVGKEKYIVHEITNNLCERFLLDIYDESSDTSYEIHQKISEEITSSLSKESKNKYISMAVKHIGSYLSQETSIVQKNLKDNEYLEDHIKSVSKNVLKNNLTDIVFLEFLIDAFHASLFYMNERELSKRLLEFLDGQIKSISKTPAFHKARFLNTRGKYNVLSDINKSIEDTKASLLILSSLSETNKTEAEKFLSAINNLVNYYQIKGHLKKALLICEDYEEVIHFLNNDMYGALYYSFLSLTQMQLGNLDISLASINKSIDLMDKGKLPVHIFVFILVNKAEVLARLGRSKESTEMLIKINEILTGLYKKNDDHMIVRSLVISSINSLNQKDYVTAKKLVNEAAGKYDHGLVPSIKVPIQGYINLLLGDILFEEKQYSHSLKELLGAEKIYSEIFEELESDDIAHLYVMLIKCFIYLKDYSQTKKYFKKLIDVFGVNHPKCRSLISYMDARKVALPW